MKIKNKEYKNWSVPGDSLSVEDFTKGIRKAEKGLFYSISESKKILSEWRRQRNSL